MARKVEKAWILERLGRVPGDVGFYFKDLVTGEEFGLNEGNQFQAASVIKLPMFAAIAKFVAEGKAAWTDRLVAHNDERVPPCGALWFFEDEPSVSLKTLCGLMITISDNMATNMLMRHFGIEQLNAAFREIGLEKTHIERLLFDSSANAAGKQNKIVPREMGNLLERIYRHTFVDEETSRFLESTLLEQQINHKIPGYLRYEVAVAHKTGEDDDLTNDVGIVYADEPFVICFATNNTDIPEAERAMREISLALADIPAWEP